MWIPHINLLSLRFFFWSTDILVFRLGCCGVFQMSSWYILWHNQPNFMPHLAHQAWFGFLFVRNTVATFSFEIVSWWLFACICLIKCTDSTSSSSLHVLSLDVLLSVYTQNVIRCQSFNIREVYPFQNLMLWMICQVNRGTHSCIGMRVLDSSYRDWTLNPGIWIKIFRKILCIRYVEHKPNVYGRDKINAYVGHKEPLLSVGKLRKLAWFWYVIHHDTFSKVLHQRKIEENRKQRKCWTDNNRG